MAILKKKKIWIPFHHNCPEKNGTELHGNRFIFKINDLCIRGPRKSLRKHVFEDREIFLTKIYENNSVKSL